MAREFRLPDLGSGLKEAQILNWQVAEGDAVSSEAILCEVETEKAVIEVPVPFEGVVLKLAVPAGESIAVGDVLAVIGEAGEAVDDAAVAGTMPAAGNGKPKSVQVPAQPAKLVAATRPRAMPSIRRIARENRVDLTTVVGTGRLGRITRADVLRAGTATSVRASTNSPAAGSIEKFSQLRKSIAEHMARSWREIPHSFTRLEVDATRFLETRGTLSQQFNIKIPIEALLIKAVIPVLQEYPHFNSTLVGDELTLHDRYDIGIAADTKDGLIVPVVHGADKMPLPQLSESLIDLIARTVERRATPEELAGATFTVNNIGALGHVMGTSIIPYGTAAILSAGRAIDKPVVRNGKIAIAPMMEVTLSFDHRIIDGGGVQRFMKRLADNLQQPVRFLA